MNLRRQMQGPLARSSNSPPEPLDYDPPADTGLVILFENDHLVAVDKPAGLLSVSGKSLDHSDCMAARIVRHRPQARVVHRLDRATSGIMVFALTAEAHRHLGLQFERRQTAKTYLAQVNGVVEGDCGTINQAIRTDWYNRPKQMVDPMFGREAITRWRVEQRLDGKTAVRLFPETGRSHQLRVHMAWLGHPVVGDTFYSPTEAAAKAPRLMLHAWRLGIRNPDGGAVLDLEAPRPF